MHRRCCCPPERSRAEVVQAILDLVPEGRLPQATLADVSEPARSRTPATRGPIDDVFENRFRERVRLLKDHADPAAQIDQIEMPGDRCRCRRADLRRRVPSIRVVHAVEHAQERRFPAARRANEGQHGAFGNRQRDIEQRLLVRYQKLRLATSNLARAFRRSSDPRPVVER